MGKKWLCRNITKTNYKKWSVKPTAERNETCAYPRSNAGQTLLLGIICEGHDSRKEEKGSNAIPPIVPEKGF